MFGWIIAGLCLWNDGAAAPMPDAAAKQRVEQLRQNLAHSDFAVRQRTTATILADDAKTALSDLVAVIEQGPPEAAIRAADVLTVWYAKPERVTDELEDAIERLREKTGALREMATVVWEDQHSQRDQRCISKLQGLGAKVQFLQPKKNSETIIDEDLRPNAEPIVQHVVLGRNWRGGDEGLKYIERMSFIHTGVYRVKTAQVSEEALQRLTDRKPDLKIEIRGAFLGVTYMAPPAFGFGGGPAPCLINEVAPVSPAEKAGLKKDDIIVKFGDKPVETFPDLIDLLKSTDPGEKVTFTILRDGDELRLPVELGDW